MLSNQQSKENERQRDYLTTFFVQMLYRQFHFISYVYPVFVLTQKNVYALLTDQIYFNVC